MEIVVKLREDVAEALRTGVPADAATDTRSVIDAFNLSLRPMHANRPSGPLSSYFVTDVPSQIAEQARSQLSETSDVESAVAVPSFGLPSGG